MAVKGDKKVKVKLRPIDWKSYNRELENRGENLANSIYELQSYDPEEELKVMNYEKNGHPFEFSDRCIILLAILKSITGFGYRTMKGFGSLFIINMLSGSQLCRRVNKMPEGMLRAINCKITRAITKGQDTIDIIMDGTGIMINNTHVWIDEKIDVKRMRDWKKLHLVIDRKSKAILLLEVIDKHQNEAENESMKETMIETFENIDDNIIVNRAFGDGLYDSYNNYEMFNMAGIELVAWIMKPTINVAKSLMKSKIVSGKMLRRFKSNVRNRIVIEQINWKKYVKKHEYGFRGGIEGIIGAFKRTFGEYAYSKKDETIIREFLFKQMTWNIMRL